MTYLLGGVMSSGLDLIDILHFTYLGAPPVI